MDGCGWHNCFDEVREQTEDLVRALCCRLGGDLVGVYLHGSGTK